ncbi:MAG: nitroreductase family protein [Dehalococcoidia bacterium]|nr:nitroreductase family protein [Dehalococcoidia bacterium]
MELFQSISGRRSVRRFTPEDVSDDKVSRILEAARWAPSWANTQCCRFVVVRDPSIKEALAGTLTPTNPAIETTRTAPVLIAVCAELKRSGYKKGQVTTEKGDWFMFDAGLAVENMVLAAHSLGLGTVIVALLDARKAAGILKLPDSMSFVVLLPVGHPDQAPIAPPRKPLAELVYREAYGNHA